MFFERLIRFSLKGKLDLINHLGGISTVEGSHTVIELGEAGGHAPDSKLGLGLGKPDPRVNLLEIW